MGTELADLRAKKGVWDGAKKGEEHIDMAGGIKQQFRVTWGTRQVQESDGHTLKGHTNICTNRGPFMGWCNSKAMM